MPNILKTILIIIGSMIAGGVMVGVVQTISHHLYPTPTGIDFKDTDALATYMTQVPLGAKVWVVASWAIGMMTGSGLALFLSGRQMLPATITIGLLLGATCTNFFTIPHPIWMIVSAFLVAFLVWLSAKQVANTTR